MEKNLKLLLSSTLVALMFLIPPTICGMEIEQKDPSGMNSVEREIEELERRLTALRRLQAQAQVISLGGPALSAQLQAHGEVQQEELGRVQREPIRHQRLRELPGQVWGNDIWNTIQKKKTVLSVSGGVLVGAILGSMWNANVPIIFYQNQTQPDLLSGSHSILEYKPEALEEIDYCNGITKWLFPLICQKLEKLDQEGVEQRRREEEEIREKQEIFSRGSNIFNQYKLLLNATVEDLNQGTILEDVQKLYLDSRQNSTFKCKWPMIKSVDFIVQITDNMQIILPELFKRRKKLNEANDLYQDCHKRHGSSNYAWKSCKSFSGMSNLQATRLQNVTNVWCPLSQAYYEKVKEDLGEFIKLYRIMELSRHEIWEEFSKTKKTSITGCQDQSRLYGDGRIQYTIK
jgi:hypothetical protein